MTTPTGQPPATAPQPQTENKAPSIEPSEISSLSRYMDRQKAASSAPQGEQSSAGVGAPSSAADSPATDGREPMIPRSRFDEVLNERNALRQQMQAPQQVFNQPAPQYNTGMQPQFQPQFQQQVAPQQGFSPTGMVGQQQQTAPQVNAPNWNDPKVQKEWTDKISKNPVTGLREFVSLMLQAEGGPLLEQFRQQIISQISPIQQTFVQQQLSTYTQQRQQADPSFAQVAPLFSQLVQQASQRGYTLNAQTLSAIEGIARAQTGMLGNAQPQQVPFSEQPGGAQRFGEQKQPELTPMERQVAERFQMTPEEYVAYRRTYGR